MLVLALTLTEKIGVVALTLTTATLLAAATNLVLNYRWHRRAGHAELVVEAHRLNENPRAAAGWQVFADVRNTGAAPAFAPGMWIVQGDDDGDKPQRRSRRYEHLRPGESFNMGADLPSQPGDGAMRVMLGWEDSRGVRLRDTGIRL